MASLICHRDTQLPLLLSLEAGLPPRWPPRAHPGTLQQAGEGEGPCSWSPGPLRAFLMQITPLLVCSQQIAREWNIKLFQGRCPLASVPRVNPWDVMHPEIIHNTPLTPSCLLRKTWWEIAAGKQQAGALAHVNMINFFFVSLFLFIFECLHFQSYPEEKNTVDPFLGEQPAAP